MVDWPILEVVDDSEVTLTSRRSSGVSAAAARCRCIAEILAITDILVDE